MLTVNGAARVVIDCSAGLQALAGLPGRRKKTVSNFSLSGPASSRPMIISWTRR
jgi:hypothetical protein